MTDPLAPLLAQLHLAQAAAVLPAWLERAAEQELSYTDFLQGLLEEECIARTNTATARRLQEAGFPFAATIEQFDFRFRPDLKRQVVLRYLDPTFVSQATTVTLIGPPGLGKTMLAICLATKQVQLGAGVAPIEWRSQDLVASSGVRLSVPPSRNDHGAPLRATARTAWPRWPRHSRLLPGPDYALHRAEAPRLTSSCALGGARLSRSSMRASESLSLWAGVAVLPHIEHGWAIARRRTYHGRKHPEPGHFLVSHCPRVHCQVVRTGSLCRRMAVYVPSACTAIYNRLS